MPRKTKKQKLRAHSHTAQLPRRDTVIAREAQQIQPGVTLSTNSPAPKKEQLPLVAVQKKQRVTELQDTEAAGYFRQDIQKTAFLTSAIVVLEIILYQLMQNGTLAKWIPALKI
jgi:hypothetical protein